MKTIELLRYGLPAEVIALWQKNESERLLPVQELAIKRHGLFGEENLLIQAPTSSGKTFIGEMAAVHTALRRKKVVYLVPLKALAEEKFRDFHAKYDAYGIKVIVSTRDRREYDRDLEEGRFALAVVVYEKLAQLLVRRPERLQEIDLVVADELELLSDPERGDLVELLLTRILRERVRLVGLSAVIGEAARLAEWMRARLVYYERRPVELRFGVLHEGRFAYRTYNEDSDGEEALIEGCSESPGEVLAQNVCAFAERGESCLLFVKSKQESRRGAELLAERISLPAAGATIEALRPLEPTRSRAALLHTLNHGVAFHNADLSPDERHAIETGFRAGEIRVLVSTSTLAVGLNLPAQNVFLSPEKWRYDARLGMPWKTPISRNEYENMSGRAGRYGVGHAFGRSILLATTPFDEETFRRRYVEGEREGIRPRLAQAPLENHVLRLVASRACRTVEEIADFLDDTLTGHWHWRDELTRDALAARVRAAAHLAADAGLLLQQPGERLEATPLGAAVAAKGISIATAQALEQWIGHSEMRPWLPVDLIFAAANSPDGRELQMGLTQREFDSAGYVSRLKRLVALEPAEPPTPLNQLREATQQPFFDDVRVVKAALVLSEWIEHAPVQEIEEAYDTMAGQMLSAAEQVSWLIDATAALATALGAAPAFIAALERLAQRVQFGLLEVALPLRAAVPSLPRSGITALVAHGYHAPDRLAAATPEVLGRWIAAAPARQLIAWARAQSGGEGAAKTNAPAASLPALALVVDDARPDGVQLDGKWVSLQEKQYRLIRLLAEHAGQCVPYETIYTALWGAAVVEDNQMHFQKKRLLAAIKAACPARSGLVVTKNKRGFLLDLLPEEVDVRALRITAAA